MLVSSLGIVQIAFWPVRIICYQSASPHLVSHGRSGVVAPCWLSLMSPFLAGSLLCPMACILDVESYLTVGCHDHCSLLASNQDVILIVTLLGIEKDFYAWPEIISTF